jgi:hypothetical protein
MKICVWLGSISLCTTLWHTSIRLETEAGSILLQIQMQADINLLLHEFIFKADVLVFYVILCS